MPKTSSTSQGSETPACYVVDEDVSVCHFISTIMQGAEVDTREFTDGAELRAAIVERAPQLVFFDVPLQNADVMESMIALGGRKFRGAVQLMSNRGAAVMENTKRIGEQNRLNMLPVLKKPFEVAAIQKIIQDNKIGTLSSHAARIGLHEALGQNWIEYWFQPKIDLQKRHLVGAEAVARARHPQHGVLTPNAFMPGADDVSLAAISEMGIEAALQAGSYFAQLGVQLTVSLNLSLHALAAMPLAEVLQRHRRLTGHWPGLTVTVIAKQIEDEPELGLEVAKKVQGAGLKFGIDNVGRGFHKLAALKGLTVSEMKLDRFIVVDCGLDKGGATVCKSVIDLAHSFGADAVAVGVEKVADVLALFGMGCDYGIGSLFAHPMSRERLTAILRQRAPNQWIDETAGLEAQLA